MRDSDEQVFLRLFFVLTAVAVTVVVAAVTRHGIPLIGNLPGDIDLGVLGIRRYFPIGSSILISAVLALVAHLVSLTENKK